MRVAYSRCRARGSPSRLLYAGSAFTPLKMPITSCWFGIEVAVWLVARARRVVTRARAIATRCFCPPTSDSGDSRRSARPLTEAPGGPARVARASSCRIRGGAPRSRRRCARQQIETPGRQSLSRCCARARGRVVRGTNSLPLRLVPPLVGLGRGIRARFLRSTCRSHTARSARRIAYRTSSGCTERGTLHLADVVRLHEIADGEHSRPGPPRRLAPLATVRRDPRLAEPSKRRRLLGSALAGAHPVPPPASAVVPRAARAPPAKRKRGTCRLRGSRWPGSAMPSRPFAFLSHPRQRPHRAR